MEKFKKKITWISLLTLSFIIGMNFEKILDNLQIKDKIIRNGKEIIAMYVQDREGNYQTSNAKEFPRDGYVLDRVDCKNGGIVTQDSKTKKINAKLSHADSCNLYFAIEKMPSVVESLITKANDVTITDYNLGNMGELYTFDHDETIQTTGWSIEERRDYRYIGANPNNWIKFNDEDWRIIGVFTVEVDKGNSVLEKEQLIKIIRNENIGDIAWNLNSGSGSDWPSSSLNALLNTGDYYNGVNTYSSTGLNAIARNQIEKVKWYLGSTSTNSNLGGANYYSLERSKVTCATTGECSIKNGSINTIAKVGLMYPSDYVYTYANGVDSTCYKNGSNCTASKGGTCRAGWLYNNSYQFTITPDASAYVPCAFGIWWAGYVDGLATSSEKPIRPSVYLKSNVKIVSGDGSQESPYTLG